MRHSTNLLLVFGLMIVLQACSSDGDPVTSNTSDPIAPLVLKTINVVNSDGEEFQIQLICSENKLRRIEFPSKRMNFYYEGELISREETQVETPYGASMSSSDYEYDSESRLIGAYWTNSNNAYHNQIIEYTGNMATVQETMGNASGTTSEQVTNVWFNNGNVMAYSIYGENYRQEFELTYDNKPNIFSGIKGLEKLKVVLLRVQSLVIGANNAESILGINGTNLKFQYNYQYNSQGYPINIDLEITVQDGTKYEEGFSLEYY